ncbi:MAG: toll/interleukin-1 receptor domain-containing protein, partial [Mogibacterium sp.]|nr:toll/interleukin-1 receptor domain-containing protein [Mogibacterium sp.]
HDRIRHRIGSSQQLNSKARVFITAHPDDGQAYLDRVVQLLQEQQDCIVYYFDVIPEEPEAEIPKDEIGEVLREMQLIVVLVTRKLLTEPNPAMDVIVPYALEHNIPVLPLMMEADPAGRYQKKFGDLQFLVPDDPDPTAIPFEQKLASYLSEVLVSDDVAQRVRDAFDALVFLSYRKKDREYARELMRMIHRNPRYRDIAFWYDEFLVPGEDFNDGIQKALDESDLFTMVVTPNLLEDPNFVMYHEYPAARNAGKKIFPVEMKKLDDKEKKELKRRYQRIPKSADGDGSSAWDAALEKQMRRLAIRTRSDDPQHTFLIGLAYLDGINMEVDQEKGVAMITEAADAGLEEAMRKLASMYYTGKGVRRSANDAADWHEKLVQSLYDRYRKDDSDENLQELAREQNNLGNRLYRAKRIRELYRCLHDQKTWAEESVSRGLSDSKHDLAVCCSKLGEINAMLNYTWDGVKFAGEAVKAFRELLEEDPSDSRRRDLLIACRSQAGIYKTRRDREEALE